MIFHRSIILGFVVFIITGTNTAFADSLTVVRPLSHEGLIFSEPLTFSENNTAIEPVTITFNTSSTAAASQSPTMLTFVTPPTTATVILEQQLITPTPTSVTPTPTLSPTPTKTPIPTKSPSPTLAATVTPQATPTPQTQVTTQSLSNGGLNADKLFSMVNAHRATKGLPAFEKHEKSCQLAITRAPEVEAEVASGALHQGLKNRNLDYWNTENIIAIRTEEEALSWWLGHGIHREAIESDKKYSCIACFGNSCAQEFTNFQPK